MQGRNKTNQPRHEYEDLDEGIAESADILENSSIRAGEARGEDRSTRAGGRNTDRAGEPLIQSATRSRDDNVGNAGKRPAPKRVDSTRARRDDAIDLRYSADAEDTEWHAIDDARGRLSDLFGRGSQFLGSLREKSGGLLEQLRSASGGLLGNRGIANSAEGVDGEEVDLSGKRVAVLAADGVEKVELTVPVKALKAAGADVEIVSLRPGRIRSVNLHEPASRIAVDRTILEADASDYDALLIPGGLIGPDLLRQSSDAREFVQAFDEADKPIAAICHGGWLLASAKLTKGRVMTSWPGVRDDMVNAGATWLDEEVVQDGNWVTSRSPEDLKAFVPAMLSLFAREEALERADQKSGKKLAKVESAPQHAEPPQMMLDVMKRMPRPSMRTAAMLGVLGAAVLASRAMRR